METHWQSLGTGPRLWGVAWDCVCVCVCVCVLMGVADYCLPQWDADFSQPW